MSGVVSGIAKVFSTVGSAAARIGKAVVGVGSSLFTAGAATGAPAMATGGFSNIVNAFTGGGGVLGNVLGGAVKQAGFGALLGGITGAATGQGFAKGAVLGGLGGAANGAASGAGLFNAAGGTLPADTATGFAPTGTAASAPSSVAAASAVPAATGNGNGLFSFLGSENGGAMLAGLGEGLTEWASNRQLIEGRKDITQMEIDAKRDEQQRITDSYSVDPKVLHQPTIGRQAGQKPRYSYDPRQGRVVMA